MVAVTKLLLGPCLSLKISLPTSRVFLRRGSRPGPMNLACRSWKRVGRRWASWGSGVQLTFLPPPSALLAGGSPQGLSSWSVT